jgi:methylated-DNA-[protein]-cysteine S-methyltransferase
MSKKPAPCLAIEHELLAAAMGEASDEARRRVERHVEVCSPCRRELQGYLDLNRFVVEFKDEVLPEEHLAGARHRLDTRLADLRSRLLTYSIFPSPLGNILIAQSELGISTVEYLERKKTVQASRLMLRREPGMELVEGGRDLESAYEDLMQYLQGRAKRLEWPVDLRLVRSDFHRSVLEATAAIPYGAVVSYAGLAREVGKPTAPRAVAQALRWNPLPIVIPCHRVIGSSGALTGYAGNRLGLKRKLLTLEGVPTRRQAGEPAVHSRSMYVAYPGMGAYCLPTCAFIQQAPRAPVTRFARREDAEEAGHVPCRVCRPDLHPLTPSA